jgi:hypothetical protein
VAGVVQAGAVVGDGQFLDLLDGARVIDGDGGVVAQRVQEEHLLLDEGLDRAIDELDDAQHPLLRFQRHADDGARLPLGHLVDALGEAGVGADIRHQQRLAVARHPARDALAHLQADGLERLGRVSHRDGEVEFVLGLVHHEQRPGVGAEVFRHLVHDRLQDGIQVERRGERLRHIMEDVQLLDLLLAIGCSGLRHERRVSLTFGWKARSL